MCQATHSFVRSKEERIFLLQSVCVPSSWVGLEIVSCVDRHRGTLSLLMTTVMVKRHREAQTIKISSLKPPL